MTPPLEHMAILASAGTGKTFQLTSRYIALLVAGVAPEQILATTFTRKAAGEILGRVLTRLARASLSDEAALRLSDEIGVSPAEAALDRRRWQSLLTTLTRSLNRLSISTLDAFFSRVASGFALELGRVREGPEGGGGTQGGAGLSWEIAPDEVLAELRTQAISRVLASPDRQALADLFRRRTSGHIGRSVHRELQLAVQEAYGAFAASEAPAWEAPLPPPPLDEAGFRNACELAAGAPVPVTAKGEPRKGWVKAIAKALELSGTGDFDAFIDETLIARLYQGAEEYDRGVITGAFRESFAPLLGHVASVLLTAHHRRTVATRELLRRYDAELARVKAARGLMAFDDVPRLLLGASLADRLHEVYFRLDARVSHVLLDEFQDTSILQWRLLEPIIDEIVAGEGSNERAPRSLLCVGDIKQSLYAWRDAEPELLPSLGRRWPQVTERELVTNRRSSPVIMEAVNAVFGSLDTNGALAGSGIDPGTFPDGIAAVRWHARFRRHVAHETFPGRAALLTPSIPDGGDPKDRAHLLRFAAGRVAELHHASAVAPSIGVLFRSKRDIPTLKRILSDAHGLHASEEGGNPLADSPPVAVALSLLTLAGEPGNTAAAFHVAHSPLGRVVGLVPGASASELHRVTSEIRRDLVNFGYARTLQRWLLGVLSECAPADAQRFEQLVALAQEHDGSPGTGHAGGGGLRPGDFVRLVESRRVDDPTAAPIRLMSIHASKGLEFDCVVLPDLDRALCVKPPGVLARRDSIVGDIDRVTLAPRKGLVWLDADLRALYTDWRLRTIRDEICALYVSMTRAVRSLDMIVKPSASEPTLSLGGILRGALAPGVAPEGSVLWTIGDSQWQASGDRETGRRSHDGATPPPLAAPTVELDWSSRTRFLPGTTPAGRAVRAATTLPRTLKGAGDLARERGILMHAWLALIDWLDEGDPTDDALLDASVGLGLVAIADVRPLMAELRAALAGGSVRAALCRSSYRADSPARPLVWREQPFAVPDGTSGIVTGRFDRLVALTTQGFTETPEPISLAALDPSRIARVEIIDFKSDARGSQDHGPQLRAYEQAAATLLGLPAGKVTSRVLFIRQAP